MKNYYNFINENFYEASGYSTEVDEDNIINIISEYCKDFSWNDPPIYRGVNDIEHKSLIINPNVSERKSTNTQNFYTYIIDNGEEWKDYPDRGRSLICSMDRNNADEYGNSTNGPHRVIPFDGAKIGICPSYDIWDSFNFITRYHGIDTLNEFNDLIFEIGIIFDLKFNDLNKYEFFSNLELLFSYLNDIDNDTLDKKLLKQYQTDEDKDDIDLNMLKDNILIFPKSLDELNKLFSPSENSFRLLEYMNLDKLFEKPKISKSNAEVWTDSKCLIIPDYIAKKMKYDNEKF